MRRRDLESLDIPRRCGVYVFRDASGRVLYVGKSRDLRARVRSYFGPGLPARKKRMIERAASVEFFVTGDEREALLLEFQLINTWSPPYNVVFRDDKSYPVIEITREKWPRMGLGRMKRPSTARRGGGAGGRRSRMFGPFTEASDARAVLEAVRLVAPLRRCRTPSSRLRRRKSPCIDYQLGLCLGPCRSDADPAGYAAAVEKACTLLEGRTEELERELEERMYEASAALNFERAAALRDALRAVRRLKGRSRVVLRREADVDVAAAVVRAGRGCIQLVCVRAGRLVGMERTWIEGAWEDDPGAVLLEWLGRIYPEHPRVAAQGAPSRILLPARIFEESPGAAADLGRILSGRLGRAVRVEPCPSSGELAELYEMALDNASAALLSSGRSASAAAFDSFVEREGAYGGRVECFDVSNEGHGAAVASMAVAEGGRLRRSLYRRFRIGGVEGVDDFSMLAEALRRRLRRRNQPGWEQPSVLVVDGGKGQYGAARKVLEEEGVAEGIVLLALAKREERIFRAPDDEGVVLPPSDPVRLFLQRLRDEAHRFAVEYHRSLRERRSLHSVLTEVEGVGEVLASRLLRRFGDVESIASASIEELCLVRGISERLAARIVGHLRSVWSRGPGSV